ncbi:hypothetical protein [Spirosoma rhododendri]|uniref:Uncharacterized protein n=1 Tax=Spirosoma rhododendri TaxID=2728024 RepID=A0A7L5DSG7_9BACT|nr:hypothetical protein [Spirosoma rhododendri]QJD80401.1 hypothetical protein HH216_19705 [Spirosoma rhododendri]
MKETILPLLNRSSFSHFVFKSEQDKPSKHLREVSKYVPDVSGLYFVFAKEILSMPSEEHLRFYLDKTEYHLLYFGKAGGTTQKGKVINQKLKGRINNVVGNPSIKRAVHWNSFMIETGITELYVYWCSEAQPQSVEGSIYNYLNANGLAYPVLNRRLGRPPVIIE